VTRVVPDTDGFDAFYRATRQRMFQCMYALTGDAAEAQDAVQEAYTRAWERWSTVSGYADAEAWVRTVARRIAVSRWRRARNRLAVYRRMGALPSLPGPGPDAVALVTALAQLPLAQRITIVLHHLMDLPVVDVARETGVPVGTVKARLSRGRRALAGLLAVGNSEDSHV
jgi:RNA polymerase sigma-70 factor, ECF subfamily